MGGTEGQNSLLLKGLSIAAIMSVTLVLAGGREAARAAFPGASGAIVFGRDLGGFALEIYRMDGTGNDQTNLTNEPALDWYPSWSPDGSKIAFASPRRE